MPLFNRETGEQATPEQEARVIRRANDILDSPYSAPELVAWAMDVIPPDQFEARFWESVRKGKERRRVQQAQ
jgi:hypothetical protein